MNAADMNPYPSNPQESLSALADGELEVAALSGLFAEIESDPQSMGSWHAYQVIGDVLRSSGRVVSAQAPGDFLAGVRERLKAEGALPPVQPVVTRIDSAPVVAANDAVFRWKMVAGVASVAAVMAVSWNLIGGAPRDAGGASGPQLASIAPAPASPPVVVPVASVAPSSPSTEVVVNTGQGVVIRDARLEELLAEHRQHGGMSALQMPTGFIRGATYDASGR
ncbi:sigma-E factor negative regulatory protein [Hydrogenophaga sp.]|uniref:sigma-E factor negative regulatory protein n=1 Tax=Hydrogenophaga sp. TaxID=1904254 RepID=UPI003F700BDF